MTRFKVTHIGYVEAKEITDVPDLMRSGKKIHFTKMLIENDEINEDNHD
jgi:hypothetical protein